MTDRRGSNDEGDATTSAIINRMQPVVHDMVSTVRPIYSISKRGVRDAGTPTLVGSSVLLTVADHPFLLTAAHVIDQAKPLGLGVLGEPNMVELGETRYFSTVAPKNDRTRDNVDVGFFELSAAQVELLGDVRFLGPADLDVDDTPSYFTYTRTKYVVVGYPAGRQGTLRNTSEVSPTPLFYMAQAAMPEKYSTLGVDVNRHLLLPFDRKNVLSHAGRTTAPNLNGMSGCGVWRIDSLHGLPGGRDQLVALFIEWHRGDHRLLIATRIDQCLHGIREAHPELAGLLSGRRS